MLRMSLSLVVLMFFGVTALADPLDGIVTAPEVDAAYDRPTMYGSWRDDDGDCINNRHEVLALESLVPITMDDDGCKVESGLWFDPYTGLTFTDPSDLDIDHLVPLKEAHQSGAHAWSNDKRKNYANDMDNPGHLIAVDDGTNQSKGHRDPADWMPPNLDFHCAYIEAWLAVKVKWELTVDSAEETAITSTLASCEE